MIAPLLALGAGVLLWRARRAAASNLSVPVPGAAGAGSLFANVTQALMKAGETSVEFKEGVKTNWSPRMAAALPVIERVSRQVIGRGAVITSGTDGSHSSTSKHYTGDALDLRTRDLTTAKEMQYALALNLELNRAGHVYDVIVETEKISGGKVVRYRHIHIEVDPKKGTHGVIKI